MEVEDVINIRALLNRRALSALGFFLDQQFAK
jgi:hypothetical protein